MRYEQRLGEWVAGFQKASERRHALSNASPWSPSFVLFLLVRQWRYLAWTIALLVLQIAEVAILAFGHFVYFPPESLELLRVLSALSLLGVIVAKAHGSLPRRDLSERKPSVGDIDARRVLLVGQSLFLLGCAAGLGVAVWLAAGTTLHLSTPPIYRAVLVAGVLALPFDLFSSYMFYNLRAFRPAAMRLDVRPIAIGVHLVALLWLYLDLPLLFLGTVLAPRVWVTLTLWRRTSGRPLRELGRIRIHADSDAVLFVRRLARRAAGSLAPWFALELSFLLMYSQVTRADENLALLLFFAHKMAHVATALAIKTQLYYAERVRRAARIQDRRRVSKLVARMSVAVIVYLTVALALFPLLIAKRNLVFWVSPTGTSTELSVALVAMLVALVAARTFVGTAAAWLCNREVPWWRIAVAVALVAGPAMLADKLAPGVLWTHAVPDVFGWFLAADLAMSSVATVWLLMQARSGNEARNPTTFGGLVGRMSAGNWSLAMLELWPRTRKRVFSRGAQDGFWACVGEDGAVIRWGSRHAFLLRRTESPEQHEAWTGELEVRFSAVMRSRRLVRITGGRTQAALRELFGVQDWAAALAHLDRGRAGKTRRAVVSPLAETLIAWTHDPRSPAGALPSGTRAVRFDRGWAASAVEDEDARNAFERFLGRRGPDGDFVTPSRSVPATAGVVAVLQGGQPEVLVWLPPEQRDQLDPCRRALLRHNVLQLVEGVS